MKIEKVNRSTYLVTEVNDIIKEVVENFTVSTKIIDIFTHKLLKELTVYKIIDAFIEEGFEFPKDYQIVTVKIPGSEYVNTYLEYTALDTYVTVTKMDTAEQSYGYGILDIHQ